MLIVFLIANSSRKNIVFYLLMGLPHLLKQKKYYFVHLLHKLVLFKVIKSILNC
jgi:hypothetical protein